MPSMDSLHEAYEHARFAARFAYEQRAENAIRFEECRFADFVDLCDLEGNRALVVDANVARLHADDLQAGSQNMLTARTFIEAGFSLNATAKELSVHRNTVVYRLKLIHDSYGIDLSAPVEDRELVFQVLLSAKLLTE